jgi:WD40 repeat protein
LTDGTIAWSNEAADFDWVATSALPRSLELFYQSEPGWVDMKWAQGIDHLSLRHLQFRGAVVDLASAIRNVPKSELDSEDVRQQRRAQMLARSAVAVLTLLLALAVWLGYRANLARIDAQFQLAEALSSEGDALASTGQWASARQRYSESFDRYNGLGAYPAGAIQGLWDADRFSPVPLSTLRGHKDAALAVAFLHDRPSALSGGRDGSLLRWDLLHNTATRLGSVNSWIRTIAVSPDSRWAIVGGTAPLLWIWDLRTNQLVSEVQLTTAPEKVRCLPDSVRFLVADSTGRLSTRALQDGHLIQTFNSSHGGRAPDVALTSDGSHAASVGFDHELKYWDTTSGTLIRSFHFGGSLPLQAVAFHPNNQWIAVGGVDGSVRLLNIETGSEVHAGSRHDGPVRSIVATPDGDWLISSSDDNTIRVWDVTGGGEMARFVSHTRPVFSLDLSSDGKLLLSASHDKLVMLWNLTSPYVRSLSDVSNTVRSVAISPGGHLAVSGDEAGMILVRETETGRTLATIPAHTGPVLSLAMHESGSLLASGGADGKVHLWDLTQGPSRRPIDSETSSVRFVAFSPQGDRLLTVSDSVKVWSARTGILIRRCDIRRPSVASFGQSDMLLISDSDGRLLACDVRSGMIIPQQRAHTAPATVIAASAEASLALAGSRDGVITVLNLRNLSTVAVLRGHTSPILALAFCPTARRAVSISENHEMKLWDLEGFRELRQFRPLSGYSYFGFRDSIASAAISPDCSYVLTGGPHRELQLWDFDRALETLRQTERMHADPSPDLASWYASQNVWDWALRAQGRLSLLDRARGMTFNGHSQGADGLYRRASASGTAPCWYIRLLAPDAGLTCR